MKVPASTWHRKGATPAQDVHPEEVKKSLMVTTQFKDGNVLIPAEIREAA